MNEKTGKQTKKVNRLSQYIKDWIHTISNCIFMTKYIYKYIPGYAAVMVIMQALFGVYDVMWGVWFFKFMIDAITEGYSVWLALAGVGGFFLYGSLIQTLAAFVYEKYNPLAAEKLSRKVKIDLLRKTTELDIECYDNPEFYNDYIMASQDVEEMLLRLVYRYASIIKNLIAITGITAIIAMTDKLGLLMVVVTMFLNFLLKPIINKVNYNRDLELIPPQRKRDYVKRIFYLPDYAKELRLNNIKEKLTDDYVKSNQKAVEVIKKYWLKITALNFLNNMIIGNLLVNVIYYIILVYRVMVLNNLSIGSMAALSNGVWNLKSNISGLAEHFMELNKLGIYIDKYRMILDYKPKITDNENSVESPSVPCELNLKNVYFTYPGFDKPTLKNITMNIKPEEKVAIVGYNGTGKSTLIKLLMRFYDTGSGEILYDNKNIREYKLKSYRNNIASVFQDYQIISGTVTENVIMDVTEKENKAVEEKVKKSLELSGFYERLMTLENGVDTTLTKEFYDDGVNLSGGEAQKVAIARMFARDSSVIILDEPSSALDPIAEYNLNEAMMTAAKDKTVIFISHRLSTTMTADKIYMLENGEIVEEGSHKELMNKNGKYAEMFNMQSEKYKFFEKNISYV